MKKFAYLTGALAAVSFVLGFVARFFFFDKSLIGLHALTFLRITNTMLLITIALLLLCYLDRK